MKMNERLTVKDLPFADVYREYEIRVSINGLGCVCGYIKIPAEHPWHGKVYGDVRMPGGDYVEVHGGLTFSESITTDGWPQKFTPGWWIGFDCGHYGDAPFGPSRMEPHPGGVVRTPEYAISECHCLVEQAIDAGGGDRA